MEINQRELLGEGRLSLVYRLDGSRMLKVFKQPNVAGYEFRQASAAWRAGVTRQQPHEMTQEDGRDAIVYDYLEGRVLMEVIGGDPAHILHYLAGIADCHADILRGTSDTLERYKDHLAYAIAHAPHLDEAHRARLLQALQDMPDGDHVLHGDLHPLNIIVSGEELCAIDWMTGSKGDPAADIARSYFIIRYSVMRDDKNFPGYLKRTLLSSLLGSAYLNGVRKHTGITKRQVMRWIPFIAAARLKEQRPKTEVAEIFRIVEGYCRSAR